MQNLPHFATLGRNEDEFQISTEMSFCLSSIMLSLAPWLIGALSSLLAPHPSPSLDVVVRNGTLRGVHWRDGQQDFFGGIPYASPPKRFRRAEPAVTYDGVWDAGYVLASWQY